MLQLILTGTRIVVNSKRLKRAIWICRNRIILCLPISCLSSTITRTFSSHCELGQRTSSDNRAMVHSLATLGIGCILFVGTLALPPNRVIDASAPNPAGRSVSSTAGNINPLILPAPRLNTSISTPIPIKTPLGSWAITCGEETTPPGWLVPPETHRITDPTDCRNAIFRVTRAGDPLESQTWTSQAEWVYRSCGVVLAPGWGYAHVSFPRIVMAEIAQEIARKCGTEEHGFIGGWVPIGVYFIVLVTGRLSSETQL